MQAMPITPAAPTSAAPSSSSKAGGKAATDGQFRQHLTNAGKNSSQQEKTANTSAQSHDDQSINEGDSANHESMPASNNLTKGESKTTKNTPSSKGQKNDRANDTSPETHSSEDTIASQFTAATSTVLPFTEQVEETIDNAEEQSDLTAEQELIFNLLATPQVQQSEPESKAQHILSQRESTQVPGMTDSPNQEQKPVLTLSSLLKESTDLTNQQQRADSSGLASTSSTLQTATSQNNAQTDLTIEDWRAQFSYQRATTSQDMKTQPIAAQTQAASDVLIKESVQADVTPEISQAVVPGNTKSGSNIETTHERRDANSNFIQSNLSGILSKSDGEQSANSTGQQSEKGQQGMNQESNLQPEQLMVNKAGQEIPLIFSLSQDGGSSLSTASQQTTASQMLQLPSGSEIPHSQIVNQVVDRFTLNRTLESGSITMKLHPAELGELRMEIKVEQDNIRAHITTQNPQVQEILDRHLPKLKEALAQQGMNLDHMEVTVATNKDSNPQNFQEHFNRQQEGHPSRSGKDQIQFALDQEALLAEDSTATAKQSLSVLA